ncbi:hypothetical protein FQA39_LY14964 [Lamprigera yunnana]|nr:hypothetical protein FQA39_LY14964 [Lamprigera yunnana]
MTVKLRFMFKPETWVDILSETEYPFSFVKDKLAITEKIEEIHNLFKEAQTVEDSLRRKIEAKLIHALGRLQNCQPKTVENRNVHRDLKLSLGSTFHTMWKPRKIGLKTLTFEMTEEKKIFRTEDMSGNEVYLGWESLSEVLSLESVLRYRLSYSSEIQFFKNMWMLYAQEHWTKTLDLKSAVERLYEKPGALEFDADNEAIYGMERYYTVQQCEDLRDIYKIGRKVCRKFLKGKTCYQFIVKRISEIGLRHFLDTINKYIKDCGDSSSSDEEVFKVVEQNGKGSKTTEEE